MAILTDLVPASASVEQEFRVNRGSGQRFSTLPLSSPILPHQVELRGDLIHLAINSRGNASDLDAAGGDLDKEQNSVSAGPFPVQSHRKVGCDDGVLRSQLQFPRGRLQAQRNALTPTPGVQQHG